MEDKGFGGWHLYLKAYNICTSQCHYVAIYKQWHRNFSAKKYLVTLHTKHKTYV